MTESDAELRAKCESFLASPVFKYWHPIARALLSRLGDAKAPGREFGLNDIYQAWYRIGADAAGLKWGDFVCHLTPTETPKEKG